jgi:hypothetical protein
MGINRWCEIFKSKLKIIVGGESFSNHVVLTELMRVLAE